MAIGWFSLLKAVPWVDVIKSAPVIADGAKKLWNTVGKKPPPQVAPQPPKAEPATDAQAQLQVRLAAMESTARELHGQVLASTELIKALADQNEELVKRVEANRIRLLWLSGVVVVLAAIMVVSLVVA